MVEARRGRSYPAELIDRLLVSGGGTRPGRLSGQLLRIGKHVREVAAEALGVRVTGLRQLRQSRIATWIEDEGLRRARYLSGLRTVEQVERYDRGLFEGLAAAVGRHHPLGGGGGPRRTHLRERNGRYDER